MRMAKDDIPAKINVPGAVARQAGGFGEANACGAMAGEYFSIAAGTDMAPLLKGLKDDSCDAPHWGYMIAGEVVVSYKDGKSDTCRDKDLFYWPPGHTVRVMRDAEIILFSPLQSHAHVMDHMLNAMKG